MTAKLTSNLASMLCPLAVVLGLGNSTALAAGSIALSVVERSGTARAREPVTSGVPFPKGELRSVQHVRLLHDGQEVPAQFRAAGRWHPDDSIRWLLVDFQTDLAANAQQTYTVEYGDGVTAKAKPAAEVRMEETDGGYVVDTGAARFDISKQIFDLFREVRLADGTLIVPRTRSAEPRFGAVLRGLKPMVTRALPDPANKGRSHLIHVVSSPAAAMEDYTLRFTSPREFEVTGATLGLVGSGAYLRDFTSKDGFVSIPAGAWLNYAFPEQGDVYHFRTIPAGSSAVSESVWETSVLERGPLRSVIRIKGSLGPAHAPVLEFSAWYHFYAGSGRVKLAFTLENNHHGGRTPDGNARNANIGGINCVFFDAMHLRLPLALGHAGRVGLGGSAAGRPLTAPLNSRTEIYQDSSGGPRWNRYQAAEFHPRPNSGVRFRGYRVFTNEAQVAAGDRALGWLDVSDAAKGLTVSVADFWQNYPKALAANPDGTVEIGLFPGHYAADFPLRSGEHKTHEILFFFHAGAAPDDGNKALARAFSDPLRLEPSPQWFARTRALGDLHPFDMENYRAYEVRNLSAIGEFPEGVPQGPSLVSRREEHEFHGWMDYGDVPIDFEAPSGQWGMKYDLDFVLAQQWARTLHPQWWDLLVAADRHTRDIDLHHQPHYPGLHFVKGGVWAHSLHAEPGHKNPHRNHNHFTKDLCFGARGTAALYYLTGDWKAHDACLEIAENALAEYMSPQRDPGPPERNNRMGWRGDGGTLQRLLEGYLLSGNERFLRHARWQIKSCAFDGKPPRHEPISLWSSLFHMEALARYVELFPDDASAQAYLLAHAETLRQSIHPENGIYYTITPRPDGSVTGNGECSHYNIMAADVLAFAHRLTGRTDFLDAARRCFACGVKNANGQNSTPTYFQVHSANGAMHGNLFMTVDSAARNPGTGLPVAAQTVEPAELRVTGDWQIQATVQFNQAKPGESAKTVTETLAVAPAARLTVKAERHASLPLFNPQAGGWSKGPALQGVKAQECATPHLLDPESLTLRTGPEPDAPLLELGKDYAADLAWGTFGRLAGGRIREGQPVFASYRCGELRLDSVILTPEGRIRVRQGEPRSAAPVPPPLHAGERRLANIWLPGRVGKLSPDHLFPITETAFPEPPPEHPSAAEKLLPKTVQKLRDGRPLRILAWGDSVTVGTYLPDPARERWQAQFVTRLRQRFPAARVELLTEAWGGRNTGSYLAEPPGSAHHYQQKVLDPKPDLIVSEFVNDAGLTPEQVETRYGKLLADFQGIGAEWIILTPHYVRPDWMGLMKERDIDEDPRSYVKGLRRFAVSHRVALADAALRYGRLWRQGIPYSALMLNSINHPDARGMSLFADSLMALFPTR